jgi:aminoglycoside phosphotransferase (APT) family kinase protein
MAVGARIGRGRTAEVFAWGQDQVVKLFYADFPIAAIEREIQAAGTVAQTDMPAPGFGGTVQVDNRTGLVFERVRGPSMLSLLAHQPWQVLRLARELAHLHARMHALQATGLQSLRSYAQQRIDRAAGPSDAVRSAAVERLNALPDGARLCHGDFHPDNVVITPGGPVVLDWMNATAGAPAGDVARTLLLLEHATPPSDAGLALRIFTSTLRRVFAAAYWRAYARTTGLKRGDVDAWQLPLIVARFAENLPSEEREHLRRLLASTDRIG